MITSYSLLFISLRYLKSTKNNKLPSLGVCLAFLGMFLSVAVLIIVMSVFNGFKEEFTKIIIGITAPVNIYSEGRISDYETTQANIKNTNIKFRHIYPLIEGQGMVTNFKNNSSDGVMINGISQGDFLQKPILKNSLKQGSLDNFNNLNGILVGEEMAFKHQIQIGDRVRVIVPNTNQTMLGLIPRHKDMPVLGIFKIGISYYDSNLVIMPFDGAQKLLNYQANESSKLAIELDNLSEAAVISSFLNQNLDIRAVNWQEENASFINAIKVQSSVMFVILSLFLILSVFMIFGMITNLINTKGKQIAILKALGLSKQDIIKIFIINGGIISLTGILSGIVAGVLVAANIEAIKNFLELILGVRIFDGAFYFVSFLPSKVYFKDIVFVTCFAGLCSLLAIILASKKTAHYSPAQAMKYE